MLSWTVRTCFPFCPLGFWSQLVSLFFRCSIQFHFPVLQVFDTNLSSCFSGVQFLFFFLFSTGSIPLLSCTLICARCSLCSDYFWSIPFSQVFDPTSVSSVISWVNSFLYSDYYLLLVSSFGFRPVLLWLLFLHYLLFPSVLFFRVVPCPLD